MFLDMAIWADDILVFASDESQAKRMMTILYEELAKICLEFKPSSLEFLNIWREPSEFGGVADWKLAPGVSLPFRPVGKMNVLGIVFTAACCYKTMAQHRVAQAWVHYKARETVFLDRRVPLRLRLQRLFQTVGRTLMYGAGIWGSSVAARDHASTCILSMARFMLRRIEVPGESMGSFCIGSMLGFCFCSMLLGSSRLRPSSSRCT